MDLVLKLRELRRHRNLSQADVARKCGIGVKTLSSFETGERIRSMKLIQLQRLLRVYEVTEEQFFGSSIEHLVAPWEQEKEHPLDTLMADLRTLPEATQSVIMEKLRLAIELARDLASPSPEHRATPAPAAAPESYHNPGRSGGPWWRTTRGG